MTHHVPHWVHGSMPKDTESLARLPRVTGACAERVKASYFRFRSTDVLFYSCAQADLIQDKLDIHHQTQNDNQNTWHKQSFVVYQFQYLKLLTPKQYQSLIPTIPTSILNPS